MQKGFSLVELATVIVLLGLVFAGVTIGQNLQKQAALKDVVVKLSEKHASATKFVELHGCLPGDCGDFLPFVTSFQAGNMDNYVDTYDYANENPSLSRSSFFEVSFSRQHMTESGLSNFTEYTKYVNPLCDYNITYRNNYAGFAARSIPGYFGVIVAAVFVDDDGSSDISPYHVIMDMKDAYKIDSKLDDGYSGAGEILGIALIPDNICGKDGTYNYADEVSNMQDNYDRCSLFYKVKIE